MFSEPEVVYLFLNAIGYGLILGIIFYIFRILFFRH